MEAMIFVKCRDFAKIRVVNG